MLVNVVGYLPPEEGFVPGPSDAIPSSWAVAEPSCSVAERGVTRFGSTKSESRELSGWPDGLSWAELSGAGEGVDSLVELDVESDSGREDSAETNWTELLSSGGESSRGESGCEVGVCASDGGEDVVATGAGEGLAAAVAEESTPDDPELEGDSEVEADFDSATFLRMTRGTGALLLGKVVATEFASESVAVEPPPDVVAFLESGVE
jgi:hypothetical protein